MINLNSPTVQSMLANTPSGGLGNMPMGYGNMPTVETVYPSPQYVNISPYPDPYSMISGAGLSQYMPMPTYNFTGALNSNPLITNGNTPMYRDINQPVMGGLGNLPIPGYSNPFMSFTGGAYNAGGLIGYEMKRQERYFKYLYASDEDKYAMDMGFDSMAEMKSNEISIIAKLSIMAKNALGANEEEIEEIKAEAEENIAKIEKRESNKPSNNPFDLSRYQTREEDTIKPMHVKIVKNGEIVCEVGGENNPMPYNSAFRLSETSDILRRVSLGLKIAEHTKVVIAEKYANAPERQLDNMDISEFFNEGFGIVHYYDRMEALKTTQNVTRLFDSNEFRRKLQAEYGTPQMKRRIFIEDSKNFRGPEQLENDLRDGLIRGGYGYMPGGKPLSPGVNPNIGSAISYNVNDGGLYINLPPELDDNPVSNKYSQSLMSARERFIRSIGK